MVKWLAQKLQASGARIALVSGGYGATNGKQNDEALELAETLPDVPHIQNRDRVTAATEVIREHNPQVIILDDGFQHRRLARDLDIVLLDALEPFGFDHVFPRGTLREPLGGLARAHAICLSRSDAIATAERRAIRKRVSELAPHAAWCELAHAPSKLTNSFGESAPLESLAIKRIAAFCGIGNPAGFRHTLSAVNIKPLAWREFPDHHTYTPADQAALTKMARDQYADAILCTHKDLVKLRTHALGGIPLWAVSIEMKFLAGQEKFEQLLDQLVSPRLCRG
jgi:tetraacyldisaccharide 4'-kinase